MADARFVKSGARSLITPEGVDLGVTLGDAGQRVGAFLIDALLLIMVLVALTFLAIAGIGQVGMEGVGILWLLGFFFLRNFYFIVMELRPRAATFGKMLLGLRVVARDGGRLTADAVIARNLMREIEVFVPLSFLGATITQGWTGWLGLGWAGVFLVFPLTNRDRLRVGDLLAGTCVIRTARYRLVRDLATTAVAPTIVFTAAQLDAYGVYELETLESVLRRSDKASRRTVAEAIARRIDYPHDVRDVDGFLTTYYTQLRARLESGLLMGRRRVDKHDRS